MSILLVAILGFVTLVQAAGPANPSKFVVAVVGVYVTVRGLAALF